MAKNKKNIKDFAKENERMRNERIAGTNNGMTLRTRSIPNKKNYTRKQKHSNKDFESIAFLGSFRKFYILKG